MNPDKSPAHKERMLAYYHFEGGDMVQVVCCGPVSTEEAMETALLLIGTKLKEIERKKAAQP